MSSLTDAGQVPNRPRVLIVGAGATGVELARRLCKGWQVTMLDIDPEPARAALCDAEDGLRPEIVAGDASSRLVLERANAASADAVVVAAVPEEVTREVAKVLKRDLKHPNVIALLRRGDPRRELHGMGVEVVHGFAASAAVLASAVTKGSRVAAGVGLGAGEIMETDILPNSSVVGKPLSALHPRRWLVAAVYRDQELIVPHGDTRLDAGDRVLLVGEPSILPSIARFLRTGYSEFPLHYGTTIIVPVESVRQELLPELAFLLRNTKAEAIEFVTCQGTAQTNDWLAQWATAEGLSVRFSCSQADTKTHLAGAVERRDVGILVQQPEPLAFLRKLGLGWTPLMRRIGSVQSPVLITRGTFPYERILLALTDEEFDAETAILAIDAARNFNATLSVAIAIPPAFVTGEGGAERLRRQREDVRELAAAYNVRVLPLELEGNPVAALLATAPYYQLLVLGFRAAGGTSLSRPSVEQNLVHRAPCSVLVLPV